MTHDQPAVNMIAGLCFPIVGSAVNCIVFCLLSVILGCNAVVFAQARAGQEASRLDPIAQPTAQPGPIASLVPHGGSMGGSVCKPDDFCPRGGGSVPAGMGGGMGGAPRGPWVSCPCSIITVCWRRAAAPQPGDRQLAFRALAIISLLRQVYACKAFCTKRVMNLAAF